MKKYRGFSLTEVLISLFLISSASVGFITQQCHLIHLLNQLTQASEQLVTHENNTENRLRI